jgi:hypothetical protein
MQMIARTWADVAAGCLCEWTGCAGGWARTGPHPMCPAVHQEGDDEQ